MNTSKSIDIVTIGESMLLMQPISEVPLTYASLFTKTIAGAESNVAIGLSRLGHKVRWISRLGRDPFGDTISSLLAGEGVDVALVERDEHYPTAMYFKEYKGYGDPNVYYYRKGSAMSRLSPAHVKDDWFNGAKHLHVTGITPALGPHSAEAIRKAMIRARELGLTVSFDPNLRRKLWSEEESRHSLLSLIPLCDLFLPGEEEAEFLIGKMATEAWGAHFLARGPSTVVIKLGERGSVGFTRKFTVNASPHAVQRVVDTIGAGDAFAAGLLSSFVEYGSYEDRDTLSLALKKANMMGALATQFKGDWEGLPGKDELDRLLSGAIIVTR